MPTKLLTSFVLILLLAVPATAAAPHDAEVRWLTSVDAAIAAANASGHPILVDLYAEWCGWCKALESKVFSTAEFRDFARGFVLLRVDVEDGGEGTALQRRFEAFSLPTTIVVDTHLARMATLEGFAPTSQFIAKLEAGLARHKAFLAFFEQAKKSDDPAVLEDLARQLRDRRDGLRAAEVYEKLQGLAGGDHPRSAWLRFLTADAYRLGRRFDAAGEALREARSEADGEGDPELLERIDLLSFAIAQESGDCERAKRSLERFLVAHPQSALRGEAERTLDGLRRGVAICA